MLESHSKSETPDSVPLPRRTFAVWLATGLGVGLVAPAPGTFGGLWGIPLTLAITCLPSLWLQVTAIVCVCLVGIPLCNRAVRDLGGAKDPGAIVFDEIASMPIVFLFTPLHRIATEPLQNIWPVLILGFALHRLFDITKPPPIRQLERLPGGLGIMADDWLAGIYSCIMLNVAMWAWPVG